MKERESVPTRHPEYQYLDLLHEIIENGEDKGSLSSGERLRYVLGVTHHYDLSQGFPLLTTKDVFWKGVRVELEWFLKGDTNIKFLVDNGVHIWDGDCYKIYERKMKRNEVIALSREDFIARIEQDEEFAALYGNLGPVYGAQWRNWVRPDGKRVDQLEWNVDKLRNEPYRKHLVFSAWNPANIYEMAPSEDEEMALVPCHMICQIDVSEDGKLSLMMTQRSCDMFLGVPFNIASYALLTHIFAEIGGFKPGKFIHTLNNAHIYHEHFDAVREQLKREPRPFPTLKFTRKITNINDFHWQDARIVNYQHHEKIPARLITVGGTSGRVERRT